MFFTNTEYSSYAWQRARNYNSRIFSDLDAGTLDWASIHTKLDPTSMMQEIEAVPKPEFEVKKKEEDVRTKPKDDPPCP